MFDYFRNCLSNPHQVCFEDSPIKGPLLSFLSPMTLLFTQRSQLRHKLGNCSTCTITAIRQYLCYGIRTWRDGRRMQGMYAHARFDDLDLYARS